MGHNLQINHFKGACFALGCQAYTQEVQKKGIAPNTDYYLDTKKQLTLKLQACAQSIISIAQTIQHAAAYAFYTLNNLPRLADKHSAKASASLYLTEAYLKSLINHPNGLPDIAVWQGLKQVIDLAPDESHPNGCSHQENKLLVNLVKGAWNSFTGNVGELLLQTPNDNSILTRGYFMAMARADDLGKEESFHSLKV